MISDRISLPNENFEYVYPYSICISAVSPQTEALQAA